jgi:hypothetical protein
LILVLDRAVLEVYAGHLDMREDTGVSTARYAIFVKE